MTTSAPPRLMTAAELLELPDDHFYRYELKKGVLICMAPAAYRPGKVGAKVVRLLGNYVEAHPIGDDGATETGFVLESDPDTVRAPDAWFVRAERTPAADAEDSFYEGAPDLAVKIVSPSDRFNDVIEKAREYMTAGTVLYWGIDPKVRTALVFNANGTYAFLNENGVLDGGDLLPGLRIPLRELFA